MFKNKQYMSSSVLIIFLFLIRILVNVTLIFLFPIVNFFFAIFYTLLCPVSNKPKFYQLNGTYISFINTFLSIFTVITHCLNISGTIFSFRSLSPLILWQLSPNGLSSGQGNPSCTLVHFPEALFLTWFFCFNSFNNSLWLLGSCSISSISPLLSWVSSLSFVYFFILGLVGYEWSPQPILLL